MSELVVQLVVSSGVPRHNITTLVVTPDKRYIVSGSDSGHLCVWSLTLPDKASEGSEERGKLIPKLFLVCKEGPIVALSVTELPPISAVVSLSEKGLISLWDYREGECISEQKDVLTVVRNPTQMVSLPEKRFVAISGHSNSIEIVDLWEMKVVRIISTHLDWVSSIYSCNLGEVQGYPFLLSVSNGGTLHLENLDHESAHPVEYPLKTMCLAGPENDMNSVNRAMCDYVAVSMSPNTKLILVVTSKHFRIYASVQSVLLFTVDSPDELIGWKSCKFVSNDEVIAWTEHGVAYLYELPKLVHKLGSLDYTPPQTEPRKIKTASEQLIRSAGKKKKSSTATFTKFIPRHARKSSAQLSPTGGRKELGAHKRSKTPPPRIMSQPVLSTENGGSSPMNVVMDKKTEESFGSSFSGKESLLSPSSISPKKALWKIESGSLDQFSVHHEIAQTPEVDINNMYKNDITFLTKSIMATPPKLKSCFTHGDKRVIPSAMNCYGNILVSGSSEGELQVWIVPLACKLEFSLSLIINDYNPLQGLGNGKSDGEEKESDEEMLEAEIQPWTIVKLSDLWHVPQEKKMEEKKVTA
eukprot:CAMPEP_0174271582 /NCGR_PEP_ID=MMETSP0439-20130205/48383_1 /TAXON_ID=0 /ORGANISM="Stereomyxa ramosa, Strain Chinc5" /LENGTH=582 /DNA_ID=CAMNT_0015361687 /DNA_START=43 /DNA_END=1787 /DNA_ORIENTATION=-